MSAPGGSARHEPLGPVFWIGLALGGAVMAYGLRGALTELGPGNPFRLAVWVVGLDLAHDLVVAPVVVVLGLLLAAVLPPVWRGPVRTAAALSGVIVLFSVPLLTGWGRRAGNSSTLPLDYSRNVVVIVGLVWLTAFAVVTVRSARARGTRPEGSEGSAP